MARFYTIGETMSVLSDIFGDCPQAKIVEAFAENHDDKLYIADIVRIF
ncbi:hypothetical protein [Methanosarcina lacustris]|nr:hypothetical protein [Methanosarcina lacustris]